MPRLADNTEGCLNRNDFDSQPYGDIDTNAYLTGNVHTDNHESNSDADPRDPALEHPCIELKKVLSGGTFYYSVDFDLTNRLQNRYESM
jgi:synaptojanin